jgi:PAS domain S-box-containing protein
MGISDSEESHRQAADIVENINLGIYIYQMEDPEDDRSLRLVSANPATERLTGIPAETLLGMILDENFPGLRKGGIPQRFAGVVRDQKALEIEALPYEDPRISPGIFAVKAFPLPNRRLAVSFENITHRRETEEALRKSEEKHRQLIEIMNEGFVILNKQGIITYANKRLCDMMGYTCAELMDHPTTDFLDQANTENMQKHVASRTQGKNVPYEVEWLRKDGTILPTLVSPMPLFDEGGGFNGNVAVLTDISDLKRAEMELIEKNRELEEALKRTHEMHEQLVMAEKMASLGQITAGVAHEIKNPLGYIQTNIHPLVRDIHGILSVLESYESMVQAQNLQQQFSDIESMKDEMEFAEVVKEIHLLLEGIQEGTARTTQIVKSLGEFSRSGQEQAETGNIHRGIDSTLMLLSNQMGDRIRVTKEYGDLPEIEYYPGKLNQVFMNILSNAIQAIEDQGEIIVHTRMDGPLVSVSMADTGKGMPEEVRKRIFEPFFTTKEAGQGAGLGLSIVYNIISQHKGTIEVLSEPGKGTEFIITLPEKQTTNQS